MTNSSATMRDRITFLGHAYPTKSMAWSMGSIIRDAWVDEYGELPEKRLVAKTSGAGSHCFATYPAEFWPVMDNIINTAIDTPQGLLPFTDQDEE
tara:strand:+ start:744 stop:1028 length:285 start_codon:yes stop_codon:yes gene_type:complete